MNFYVVIQTFLLKMYFKKMITQHQEKDVLVMKNDKDLSVFILNKTDYIEKLENMIKEGIVNGSYTLTEDKHQ